MKDLFSPLREDVPVCLAEPNYSGVYPDDEAERIFLPRKKGKYRVHYAEIKLLRTPEGWLGCYDYNLAASGGGYGLSPKWAVYESRDAALEAVITQLRQRCSPEAYQHGNGEAGERAKVCVWLDALA